MKTSRRTAAVLPALCAVAALTGCGADNHSQEQSFAYAGKVLSVVNDNANMPVSVSVAGSPPAPGREVSVTASSQTMGKSTRTPDWSLVRDTLTLGSPCGKSWVGYCEASFTVVVPRGVTVSVNGKPVTAG